MLDTVINICNMKYMHIHIGMLRALLVIVVIFFIYNNIQLNFGELVGEILLRDFSSAVLYLFSFPLEIYFNY